MVPAVQVEEAPVGTTPDDRRAAHPVLRSWATVVFAIGLAAGLVMVLGISRTSLRLSGFDPYNFGKMGESIAAGHGFRGFGNLLERRAPLYPALIGLVYWIFGVHPQLFLVVQCFLFAGTCVVAYHLGRHLFNVRAGVVAGLLCAFNPMLLRYIPYLHLETQLTFLVTLMLWLMVRFYDRPTRGNGALVGLAAGAAALTKAVIFFYPPVFVVGMILSIRAARRRGERRAMPWAALATILAVMCCTIVPWTIRNYRSSGHLVLIESGTSDAFLRGFIFSRTEFITLQKPPFTDAEQESNAYFESLAKKAGTVWQKNDWQTDQILNREAKRRALADPAGVVRKSVIGLFTFWYELTSFRNSVLALALAVGAWVLAWIGWRRAAREGRPSWLLLAPVIYLNVALALLLALGRYSVPILPALLVMSAFGVDTLLDRRAAARA
jgi:4-amino-4-deoxy-L-arabinose transferase-like glycosyltransferase